MSDAFFDVPDETAEALNQGMQLSGAAELPFNAPYFWWTNGNPQMRATKEQIPVPFYGGWSTDQDGWEAGVEQYGKMRGLPLQLADMSNRGGGEYKAYLVRHLFVAPISYRAAWVLTDESSGQTSRFTRYTAGARHHVQLLALACSKDSDTQYAPWGPVVLSAKGYQAQKLLDAAKDWDKFLGKARRQHAPKVPAWGFLMCLGTFGAELKTEQVGKGNAKSPITPLTLAIPKEATLDLLKKLYVGSAGLVLMVDWLKEAETWLNAWKDRGEQGPTAVNTGVEEPEFPPDPPMDDGIPF